MTLFGKFATSLAIMFSILFVVPAYAGTHDSDGGYETSELQRPIDRT